MFRRTVGRLKSVAEHYGLKIKETAEEGVRDTVTFLLVRIDVLARSLGNRVGGIADKVIAVGDKARNLVEKIQDTGDKVPNSVESESR